MLDYGYDSFFKTKQYLDNASILHVGGGRNLK